MAEPLILALDQGTTSTRAILFTAQGQALAEAGRPLAGLISARPLRPNPLAMRPRRIVWPAGGAGGAGMPPGSRRWHGRARRLCVPPTAAIDPCSRRARR